MRGESLMRTVIEERT